MPDVSRPGYSDDAIWLASTPGARQAMYSNGPADNHRSGVRVGVLGMSMQCQTCGTVCMARHEPMVLTDNATGASVTIQGAWVGPPDDPYGHLFPFGGPMALEPTESPAKPRPVSIPVSAPRRGKDQPSRSPEARHREYERRRRAGLHRV